MRHRRSQFYARLLSGAAAISLIAAGAASAQERTNFNIPSQPLSSALNAFGEQSKMAVLFAPELTNAKISPALIETAEPEAALRRMLAGTGLTYRRSGDTFIVLQQEGGGIPQGPGAADASVEALIVTAQKKEEAIQDVPIAISAFTQKSLDAQKLEGGFDLLKAIPNVTFSKNNFTGYNFSIRGVGTKAISATTDPGVAVSFNNTTLIVNRLFEQEYFDVERVEVLRGPQGTLFGRNATSGVINVISAKPRLMEFEGDVKLETGNYNAQRVRGMVNLPIGDTLAVRLAGALTRRDGYGINLVDGSDVDDRNLWSVRATVGWEPNERFRANLLWERFEEDDERVRTSKQLCHHDPGLTEVNGVPIPINTTIPSAVRNVQGRLSQGCLPGSLYDDAAFGTPNGLAIPFIVAASMGRLGFNPERNSPDARCPLAASASEVNFLDVCNPDPYGNRTQSRDLRAIESQIKPIYRAKADVVQLNMDFDLTDTVTLSSQTLYSKDEVFSTQDFNRFHTLPIFTDSAAACGVSSAVCNPGTYQNGFYADVTPGGVYDDPQFGPTDTIVGQDISRATSTQFNQEFRLASNFDGPVNFSLGANYTRFTTVNDYFVLFNMLNLLAEAGFGFRAHDSKCITDQFACIYIDDNPIESLDGEGHNYFRSQNPYRLTSAAGFGELYWNITDALKFTAGLRVTWDQKTFTPVPSQTLLFDYREMGNSKDDPIVPPGLGPEYCTVLAFCQLGGNAVGGRGYPADPDIVQEWREPTGRIGLDWKPDLGFTDETMLYGFYSHGYKGGGANPPGISAPSGLFVAAAQGAVSPRTFEPEYVDAFELGSKNTLLDGALILNGAAFYYDYKGYQVSKIVDRSAANENFDATVWGLELEWIFSPTRNLRFNGAFGHLETKIADGEQSIDLMDRTQGNPDWVLIKPGLGQASNCVAPADLVAFALPVAAFLTLDAFCPSGTSTGISYATIPIPGSGGQFWRPEDHPEVNYGAGFFAELGGNELPNAPHWTASLGGQYTMPLPGGWEGTLRGDFYWQSQSFARVYNTQYDKLRAWTNTNISLWFEQPDWGVTAEVYVKNVFDEMPITDAFLNSDDTALTTNVFTLDPRLVGVSVRKSF